VLVSVLAVGATRTDASSARPLPSNPKPNPKPNPNR